MRDTVVACPPERAFELLCDLERLPELSHLTVAVRHGPGRAIVTGDRFEQVVKLFGVELDTEWVATEVVPGRSIRWEGIAPGKAKVTMVQRVEPVGGGARVSLEVDYDVPLGVLGEMFDKALLERRHERDAEQILDTLRAMCEVGPAT